MLNSCLLLCVLWCVNICWPLSEGPGQQTALISCACYLMKGPQSPLITLVERQGRRLTGGEGEKTRKRWGRSAPVRLADGGVKYPPPKAAAIKPTLRQKTKRPTSLWDSLSEGGRWHTGFSFSFFGPANSAFCFPE